MYGYGYPPYTHIPANLHPLFNTRAVLINAWFPNAFIYHCVHSSFALLRTYNLLRRATFSPLAPFAGDAFYAFFPLVHLLLVYVRVFEVFETDGPEGQAAETFTKVVKDAIGSRDLTSDDLKAWLLLSEGTSALFGGASLSDIAIKFMSRGLPLITAPLRVRLAFVIRQASSSSRDSKLKLTTSTRTTFPVEEDIDAVADVSSVPPEPPHQA